LRGRRGVGGLDIIGGYEDKDKETAEEPEVAEVSQRRVLFSFE
jgi:hypothetical protein